MRQNQRVAGAYAPISFRRELKLKASPAELWPLISNTNRFNRALGLPEMVLEGISSDDYSKRVRARLFGLDLAWREPPFDWVEGRFFRSIREFDRGPVARFEGLIELAPQDGGSRMTIRSDFTPRNALGDFIIRYATGRKAVADAVRLMRRFEASLLSKEPDPYRKDGIKSPCDQAALARRGEALRRAPVERALAERLIALVRDGHDDELARLRPFEVADRWGVERLPTLRAFFHAVKAGLLDLSWEVICPHCAGVPENHGSMEGLKADSRCAACDMDFGVDLGETVELAFSTNPAVRKVDKRVFCVGNPSQAPYALAQLTLRPGTAVKAGADLGAESYRLHSIQADKALWLRPSPEGASEFSVDFETAQDGAELRFKPGAVRLTLECGGEPMLVRIEKESWGRKAAKASLVTALQDFRELFSAEVLAPGVELGVKTIAMLFSDLKGSTALYEKIGDATAYALVRDHFDYLFAIIRRREGAVVKTIGDAVMAVFATGENAIEAAFEIQEMVGGLNRKLAPKPAVVIKLGVHQGPAIAINANDVFDYFGTTVNVSSRVQNESAGGDIIITEAMRSDPGVQDVLARHPWKTEEFEIRLKGLSQVFKLWRLLPAGPR